MGQGYFFQQFCFGKDFFRLCQVLDDCHFSRFISIQEIFKEFLSLELFEWAVELILFLLHLLCQGLVDCHFLTFYLSPRDIQRIRVTRIARVSGRTYPLSFAVIVLGLSLLSFFNVLLQSKRYLENSCHESCSSGIATWHVFHLVITDETNFEKQVNIFSFNVYVLFSPLCESIDFIISQYFLRRKVYNLNECGERILKSFEYYLKKRKI